MRATREGEKARFMFILLASTRCNHRNYPLGVNLNAYAARSANDRNFSTATTSRPFLPFRKPHFLDVSASRQICRELDHKYPHRR